MEGMFGAVDPLLEQKLDSIDELYMYYYNPVTKIFSCYND